MSDEASDKEMEERIAKELNPFLEDLTFKESIDAVCAYKPTTELPEVKWRDLTGKSSNGPG